MQLTFRTVMLWLFLLVVILLAWHFVQIQKREEGRIAFSDMLSRLERGDVVGLVIEPTGGGPAADFWAWTDDSGRVRAAGYVSDGILDRLRSTDVPFEFKAPSEAQPAWSNVLVSAAPFMLLIGFWIFFMVKMGGGGFNLNKATEAVVTRLDREPPATGALVGAVAATLPELRGLVTGAPRPAAVLITGPSGSGKTRLVRALAADLQKPCLWSDGSAFIHIYIGLGTARVRDFMARAGKEKAAFAAIDGIDDFCRLRTVESRAERDERSQAMQALVAALDDWRAKPIFAFIGITNRPELLDDAIIRRFDRVLTLGAPNPAARESLLRELLPGLDGAGIAARTEGWMPSDLEAVAGDAARRAGGRAISPADVEAALAARAEVRALAARAAAKVAV